MIFPVKRNYSIVRNLPVTALLVAICENDDDDDDGKA